MLTRETAADIFERVKKVSSADEVEVLIAGGESALTRFANNSIHQNVAEQNHVVSVRSSFGQRTARASTNKLDDESLRRVVQASEEIARVTEADPDLLPMVAPQEAGMAVKAPSRHAEETARTGPEQRAETVARIVGAAQKHKLTTAGIFSISESVEAIFNSRGLSAFHAQTSAEISITMLAENSSGWQ